MSLRRLFWLSIRRARRTPYRTLALAASAAILVAVGCGGGGDDGGPAGPTTGTVSGQVSAGAEAVSGATVALSGTASRSGTTGSDGRFSFAALPPGAYTAAVTLPAAFLLGASETMSKSVTVVAGQTATVNWTAQRNTPTTGTIQGQVVAGLENVADATITLTGPASRSGTSDANGRFTFAGLAAGTYSAALTLPAAFALATGEVASKDVAVTAGQTATVNWSARRVSGSPVFEVTMSGTTFTPSVLDVPAGATVRWRVVNGTHTVTPNTPTQTGAWAGTGLMNAGDTFEHTFTVAGQNYDYFCQPHQSLGMTGRIRVAP